jgi:hypothetical protein
VTTFAVLATGPSMSETVARSVMLRCNVVAVSDAYRLAPWADALASCDAAWWRNNPDAMQFAGRKFTLAPDYQGMPELERITGLASGTNSGLFALHVAVKLGATRILMLGFDMRGSHYFGPHQKPLKNTTADRYRVFQEQFARFKPRGVKILNCTPGSALTAYPSEDLACALG